MLQNEIKKSFIELGLFLKQFRFENYQKNETVKNNNLFHDDFIQLIELSQSHNGWFTNENICFALQSWANALTEENINKLNTNEFNDSKYEFLLKLSDKVDLIDEEKVSS